MRARGSPASPMRIATRTVIGGILRTVVARYAVAYQPVSLVQPRPRPSAKARHGGAG
jgi:hypothetical protein